ncbi:MAG: hypothetical protein FJW30_15760 [Acidobacteria bacterium]|nr:hypothetical protein [Acidobacteriota bacterium]
MDFDPSLYGERVAALLALAGNGARPMPLISPRTRNAGVAASLNVPASELFPGSTRAEAAIAGLWTYFGFFDRAHETAQAIHTPDGCYWHAILHRMEPDAWNSGYWFRQAGAHAVYPAVREAAREMGYDWEPLRFVDACDKAAPDDELLCRVQLAEWQILFHYCATT